MAMISSVFVRVVTPAATEPISVTEAKQHLRIEHDDDNLLIAGLIQAAREQCELETRRSFLPQTLELALERWPQGTVLQLQTRRASAMHTLRFTWETWLDLPRPPLRQVEYIRYIRQTGEEVEFPSTLYYVYEHVEPGRIVLVANASWPTEPLRPGLSIRVRYQAGYDAALLPARYRQAMLLLIGHWYENREAVITGTVAVELPLAVQRLLAVDKAGWW